MSDIACPKCGTAVERIVVKNGPHREAVPCGCVPTDELFSAMMSRVTV